MRLKRRARWDDADDAVCHWDDWGPRFGNLDLRIASDAHANAGSRSRLGVETLARYALPEGQDGKTFLTGGEEFTVAEWEVWAVREPEVEVQMECKLIEGEGLASSGDHGAAIVAFKVGLALGGPLTADLTARLEVVLNQAQAAELKRQADMLMAEGEQQMKVEEFERAVATFTKAHALGRDSAATRAALARAINAHKAALVAEGERQIEAEEFEEAVASFKKAQVLAPGNEEIGAALARARMAHGKKTIAGALALGGWLMRQLPPEAPRVELLYAGKTIQAVRKAAGEMNKEG